ncbi:MAG: phosphoenolpyruvate--protein phosphotransferase [Pyrinomonadaceae bacterium]
MDQILTPRERRLSAIAVSRGIGIGQVEFLRTADLSYSRIHIAPDQIEAEVDRFRRAVDAVRSRLDQFTDPNYSNANQAVSEIFEVQQMILDSSFVEKVEAAIRDENVNGEWALRQISNEYRLRQRGVAAEHIREKEIDIGDVEIRLLSELGAARTALSPTAGAIIAAPELRPSAVMELAKFQPAAFVTERGGWTSHTSILAREFQIPMVSGIKLSRFGVEDGDAIIVNGNCGEVILNPSTVTSTELVGAAAAPRTTNGEPVADAPATTLDGTEIAIHANVEAPESYETARRYGAKGIGLYRSESLIQNSSGPPNEDVQYQAYARIAAAAGREGVNIRTFDVGPQTGTGPDDVPEINPALGLRSIRYSLADPDTFRAQLRAIVRANADGNVSLLIPMISGLAELRRTRRIVDEEIAKLDAAGVKVNIPRIGAMIEVPSAVFTAREIARNVDFICLGTNDLVQYLLAVDRDNDRAAEWYQTLHPAVLRAIREVASAGEDAGIPVIACGEMAGSAFYVPILLGLGIRELSITTNSIRSVRRLIEGIAIGDTYALADTARSCETAADVEALLQSHYRKNWIDLFQPGLLDSVHR